MRDYKKLLNMIEEEPERSNEYLLNSSGAEPGMSQERIYMENKALTAIKNANQEIRNQIKNCL